MPSNPERPQPRNGPDTPPPGRTGGPLKIVAGITAVLSLGLAARQLTVYVTEYRTRQLRVRELVATSELQRQAGDYPAAWLTLNQALRTEPTSPAVRRARLGVAEGWLEHARVGGTAPTFTSLADTLSPVLMEGLLRPADSIQKADLLAHLGWADFLRWREGRRDLSPPARYREALTLDSLNPFAHAMMGHWLLWQGDSLRPASEHYRRALSAGRARDYVRRMQLSGLANRHSPETAAELLAVGNEMRGSADSLLPDERSRLWAAFSGFFVSTDREAPPSLAFARVPPPELLATYRWVFESSRYPESQGFLYRYQLAQLQEAAGDTAGALATSHAALARTDVSRELRLKLTALVRRLSHRQ